MSNAQFRPPRRNKRSHKHPRRTHTISFTLTDEEYALIAEAASRAGLSRGTYAVHAALAAARSIAWPEHQLLREILGEIIRLTGQLHRIGVNLNQAVTALHATGQAPETLTHYGEYVSRAIRRLDELADELQNRLP